MPIWYGYQNAIFGTQSTVNGSAVDYAFAPLLGGTWTWTGSTTNFAVRENDGATLFNGDPTNEQVSAQEQFGGVGEQVSELDGTFRQIIWDYTFEVTATDGTVYRVAVIDVDLNNDNDLNDTVGGQSEDGFYLIFPDGVPPPGQNYTVGNIVENDDFTPHLGLGAEIVCYAAGTLIDTPTGPCLVEHLKPGDVIETLDHGPQPVCWAGSVRVPALGKLAPIVFRAGAIGNERDLIVSPQHRMLLNDWRMELHFGTEEVFVRAMDLVDGDQIYRRPGGFVDYHHILLNQHEVIFAEGVESESLLPGECARSALGPKAVSEIKEVLSGLGQSLDTYGPAARRTLKSFEAELVTQGPNPKRAFQAHHLLQDRAHAH
ncbi:Hint domain-containing protein [Roseovarius phycicola]|uniref:Hint domain-containing protein n=1 Tax=Roseovarius phycicola TaxID=3080976 RepID=A0ABZ2HF64_9RHOB